MRRGQNTISVTCAIDATVFCDKYTSTNREPKMRIWETKDAHPGKEVTSCGNTPCGKSKKARSGVCQDRRTGVELCSDAKLERRFGAMRRLHVRSRAAPPERPQPPPFRAGGPRAAPSPPNPRPAARLGNPHQYARPATRHGRTPRATASASRQTRSASSSTIGPNHFGFWFKRTCGSGYQSSLRAAMRVARPPPSQTRPNNPKRPRHILDRGPAMSPCSSHRSELDGSRGAVRVCPLYVDRRHSIAPDQRPPRARQKSARNHSESAMGLLSTMAMSMLLRRLDATITVHGSRRRCHTNLDRRGAGFGRRADLRPRWRLATSGTLRLLGREACGGK
jgi:hypothetical protein